MKKTWGLALLCSLIGVSAGAEAAGVTLKLSCGAGGQDLEMCTKAADAWAAKTGNTVTYMTTPENASDTLSIFRQSFAAHSTELDVVRIDGTWPRMFKEHLMDLKPYANGAEKEHFPAMVANNTVDGKLLAMPWYTDAGLLYYRSDLLAKYGEKPPTTWTELTATATRILKAEREAGNAGLQGFVFQAKAYEGLTCDALEWVYSHGGGTIVDNSGKITINNPQAIKALDLAASWIGTIAPQGVLNYAEEESRGVFQTGNAVFMRNWPYAWSLSQTADSPTKGKVGVVALPHGDGGKSAATLGGWQLALSKYSRHPRESADLIMYLTSEAVERDRAISGSLNPTRPALYKDPADLEANPFFGALYPTIVNAVPRPSTVTGEKFNEVSSAFWNSVHDVLSGKAKAADALPRLESRIASIRRGPSWP